MFDNLLKSLFGSKSDREIKELQPIVDKVNREFAKLGELSNEQLRAKTFEFKKRIADNISEQTARLEEIRAELETDVDVETKEALYNEIDSLEDESYKKSEEAVEGTSAGSLCGD